MRFFNDIIDLGDSLDPWLMSCLNVLVTIHLVAFLFMVCLISYSWYQNPDWVFKNEVERMAKEARQEVLSKK